MQCAQLRNRVLASERFFERRPGIGRRGERLPFIELERAPEPVAKSGRQRLDAAHHGSQRRALNEVCQSIGVFIDRQRASQDEGQCDRADLRDIGADIERWRPTDPGNAMPSSLQ